MSYLRSFYACTMISGEIISDELLTFHKIIKYFFSINRYAALKDMYISYRLINESTKFHQKTFSRSVLDQGTLEKGKRYGHNVLSDIYISCYILLSFDI